MLVQVSSLDPFTGISATDVGITSFYNEERCILLIKVFYHPDIISHMVDSIYETIGVTMKPDGASSEDEVEASIRLAVQFKTEVEDHYNRFVIENREAEVPQIVLMTNFNFMDHVYRGAMVAQENGQTYDTTAMAALVKADVFSWYNGKIVITFDVSESDRVKYIATEYMD